MPITVVGNVRVAEVVGAVLLGAVVGGAVGAGWWSRVDAEGVASHTMQMLTTPTPKTPTTPAPRALDPGPRRPSAPFTEDPSARGATELSLVSGSGEL